MAVSRLRICLLNGTYAPVIGGAELQMQQQARLLRNLGHDAQVITYRIDRAWPRRETIEGVPITRTGGLYLGGRLRRRWGLAVLPVLWALWRQRRQYDLIQVQQTLELGFAAVVAGRILGKPVIARMSSTGKTNDLRLLAQHDGTIGRWMARALRRSQAQFVVLASSASAELRVQGIAAPRIHWIPNGVDLSKYRPAKSDTEGAPETAALAAPRQVLCVGHLEYIKGIDVLLHAWRTVLQSVPDARLQIAGGGSQRDALLGLAHTLGLDASVEFAGETRDVSRYLAHADLFVLPSRTEGLPNALLEAMAAELPCVATRVGACGDVIQEGVTGLLVEPEQPGALAQAILALMTNPALAQACARGGRALVEQRYSAESALERYEQLYRAALRRPSLAYDARQAQSPT